MPNKHIQLPISLGMYAPVSDIPSNKSTMVILTRKLADAFQFRWGCSLTPANTGLLSQVCGPGSKLTGSRSNTREKWIRTRISTDLNSSLICQYLNKKLLQNVKILKILRRQKKGSLAALLRKWDLDPIFFKTDPYPPPLL